MAIKFSAERKKKASLFAGKDEVDMYIGGIPPLRMALMTRLAGRRSLYCLFHVSHETFSLLRGSALLLSD
jgi:hypothetical protein